MANTRTPQRSLIEGRPALIVIDIQASTFVEQDDYFCRVIEDCVAGSSEPAHEYALQAMEYLQSGARRSLDEVLDAMDAYKSRVAAAG